MSDKRMDFSKMRAWAKEEETCMLCGREIAPEDDAIDDYGLLAHMECFNKDKVAQKAIRRAYRDDPVEDSQRGE